ncbi:MAG: hypothetical protein HY866_05475 [Chloroflexi bacterium]|nr:hypothetical protein [Chloroflexota bacterium]
MGIRWNSLIANSIATVVMWGGALVSSVVMGADGAISILAGMTALGGSAALWIVWALSALDSKPAEESQEKAKRSAPEDTRLALLLQLMSEDERQALKQRLADELGSDGENVSLAELLAVQNRQREK